ncbi:hypothetical protein ACH47Z_30540 [Streptomyces sp. NPDC020192]|uniref:hypothetical protein n=1 Tax=Streptomyces sp. NPDC020192 TaxID=3365066 RepID=UPI00378F245A
MPGRSQGRVPRPGRGRRAEPPAEELPGDECRGDTEHGGRRDEPDPRRPGGQGECRQDARTRGDLGGREGPWDSPARQRGATDDPPGGQGTPAALLAAARSAAPPRAPCGAASSPAA